MTFVHKGLILISLIMVALGGFLYAIKIIMVYRGQEDSPAKYGLILAGVSLVSAILFSSWWALF